jgi:WD40 repeat protein
MKGHRHYGLQLVFQIVVGVLGALCVVFLLVKSSPESHLSSKEIFSQRGDVVGFSPDGKQVIAITTNGTPNYYELAFFDSTNGILLNSLKFPDMDYPTRPYISLSPDVKTAILTDPNTLEAVIWDLSNPAKTTRLRPVMYNPVYDPDGKRIMGFLGNIQLINVDISDPGSVVTENPIRAGAKVEFDPAFQQKDDALATILAGAASAHLLITNESPRYQIRLAGSSPHYFDPCYYTDGSVVHRFAPDVTVTVTDLETNKMIGEKVFIGTEPSCEIQKGWQKGGVNSTIEGDISTDIIPWLAELMRDQDQISIPGLSFMDIPTNTTEKPTPYSPRKRNTTGISFSSDGRYIFIPSGYTIFDVRVWDMVQGKIIFEKGWDRFAHSFDGQWLAFTDFTTEDVYITNLSSLGTDEKHFDLTIYDGYNGPLTYINYNRDGDMIITAAHHVAIWDSKNGRLLLKITTCGENMNDTCGYADFSPDGHRIVTQPGTDFHVWNIEGLDN